MYATFFALYLSHLQACLNKNMYRKIQKKILGYKISPLNFYCIFLYIFWCWHAWRWPKYRAKHVEYMWWQFDWRNLCCVRMNEFGLWNSKHDGMTAIVCWLLSKMQ